MLQLSNSCFGVLISNMFLPKIQLPSSKFGFLANWDLYISFQNQYNTFKTEQSRKIRATFASLPTGSVNHSDVYNSLFTSDELISPITLTFPSRISLCERGMLCQRWIQVVDVGQYRSRAGECVGLGDVNGRNFDLQSEIYIYAL